MIFLPAKDDDVDRTAIYGPGWRELLPFELIVLESLAESNSDFGPLAVDLAKEATTESQRKLAECIARLADWAQR